MRDEANIIRIEQWAAKTNAETRAFMRHAAIMRWRQEFLAGLMSDEQAQACAAADIERVRELRGEPEEPADSWERDLASWAAAARAYHKERDNGQR